MKSYLSLLLIVFVFIMAGCSVRVVSPPPPRHYPTAPEYPRTTNSDFDARLETTDSMMNFVEQDNALSTIALDAAYEYDLEHTVKALSMISNFVTCDNTAERCVTPFLNENMIEEATIIADEISNFVVKDRVLSRIAQTPIENY